MSFDPAFVVKVFAALFAITNPIANVPVFLSLTEGASPQVQRSVAVTASIGTVVGCLVAVVAGDVILRIFGISVDDFRLAGGLLVLLIALTMVQGEASQAHARTPAEAEQTRDTNPADVAIGLALFLVLLCACLLAAPWVGRKLSPTATAIARRLMGIILAAIAAEMIVSSLRTLFPGLAGH